MRSVGLIVTLDYKNCMAHLVKPVCGILNRGPLGANRCRCSTIIPGRNIRLVGAFIVTHTFCRQDGHEVAHPGDQSQCRQRTITANLHAGGRQPSLRPSSMAHGPARTYRTDPSNGSETAIESFYCMPQKRPEVCAEMARRSRRMLRTRRRIDARQIYGRKHRIERR